MAHPHTGFLSTVSWSRWNLEMIVFVEGEQLENLDKNPQSKVKNQQETQSVCDINSEKPSQSILVGDECLHHCTIPVCLWDNIGGMK